MQAQVADITPNSPSVTAQTAPKHILSLLKKYGFEATSVPLGKGQIEDLEIVSKTLGNEARLLSTKIAEAANPVIDKIFESKESLSVALQVGLVRQVHRFGDDAGPVRKPGMENQVFYRTSTVQGESRTYAGWLCADDGPTIAEALRSREAVRREIRDAIVRIAGPSVRVVNNPK